MKKTHIAISILLAIASLYLMWFVGFEQGKKAGNIAGKTEGIIEGKAELSNAIFQEVGNSGYLKIPTKEGEYAVLQLIKDNDGKVLIYKDQ